ncbi:hypothetical protein OHA72_01355 [Dactylosporangium sp. NBC_01737]|uniref:hypothetical protein n=1 Tax=Dactylosporangium sp. NBC_01737 TaxID=2975959 RepID=UPI002E14DBAD|nr:hypothetical protein OHA72_01355 [Dactylosporangium sp. NBC_01737]
MCPDVEVCADPGRCADAIGQLAEAACRVYAGYLNADDGAAAVASTLLGGALDRFRPWV